MTRQKEASIAAVNFRMGAALFALGVLALLATVCTALGVDYHKANLSNVGRPIPVVDPQATPIQEALS